jgi:ribonucleoside-diphosphate reductase beta chain
VFVEGYGHFLRTAASLRWDEEAVDLSADARAWPALDPRLRGHLLRLLAGFCVGEAAVASELGPFAGAAHDPDAAACFEVQVLDEARHARFFDRFTAEVVGVAGSGPSERLAALRPLLSAEFVALFEHRLPAVARRLAEAGGPDRGKATAGAADGDVAGETQADADLPSAVALYHLLLEGLVFTAGQHTLLELLASSGAPLAGLRDGVELVLRDERWHVGFGTRLLAEVGTDDGVAGRLLDEAEPVLAAWGDAVDPAVAARVLATHRRRLRAAGLGLPSFAPEGPAPAMPPRAGAPARP